MGEPDTVSVRGPAVIVSACPCTETDHVWLAGSSYAQELVHAMSAAALFTTGMAPPTSEAAPGEKGSVGADCDSTVPSSSWTDVCPPANTSAARNAVRVSAEMTLSPEATTVSTSGHSIGMMAPTRAYTGTTSSDASAVTSPGPATRVPAQ